MLITFDVAIVVPDVSCDADTDVSCEPDTVVFDASTCSVVSAAVVTEEWLCVGTDAESDSAGVVAGASVADVTESV